MREISFIMFAFLTSFISNFVFEFFVSDSYFKQDPSKLKGKLFLRNPLLGFLNVTNGLFCFYRFGLSVNAIVTFIFLFVLVIVFFVDQKKMIIPDELVLFLCSIASVWCFLFHDISFLSRVAGIFAVSIPMFILNCFLKDSFGVGDIKLFVVCGFILGWQKITLAFLIASIACSIFSLVLIFSGRKKADSRIAFAPYIFSGVFVSLFYGDEIIDFYLSCF